VTEVLSASFCCFCLRTVWLCIWMLLWYKVFVCCEHQMAVHLFSQQLWKYTVAYITAMPFVWTAMQKFATCYIQLSLQLLVIFCSRSDEEYCWKSTSVIINIDSDVRHWTAISCYFSHLRHIYSSSTDRAVSD